MNRGERRRQERLNIGGNILYHSGGISQEAVHKHHSAGWPEPEPGKHLWTVTGVWRIADPSVARYNLDIEKPGHHRGSRLPLVRRAVDGGGRRGALSGRRLQKINLRFRRNGR